MDVFFAGFNFTSNNIDELVSKPFVRIVTVNNEYIYQYNTNSDFKKNITDSTCVCDGRIPYLFSKLFLRKKMTNLTGVDLINKVYSDKIYKSILFIGDTDETNDEIVNYFSDAGFTAAGWNPFYNSLIELEYIKTNFNYDVVFVALGCKKQEEFINHYLQQMKKDGVRLVAGIGGAYSIVLKKKHMPDLIYFLGMGSIWRLFNEFKWFRIKRLFISFIAFRYYFNSQTSKP